MDVQEIEDRIKEINALIDDLRVVKGRAREKGMDYKDLENQINALSLRRTKLRNRMIALVDRSEKMQKLRNGFQDVNTEIAQGIDELENYEKIVDHTKIVVASLDEVLQVIV
jgi:septal ring factor EnvC (AmiA/AmiB activator)